MSASDESEYLEEDDYASRFFKTIVTVTLVSQDEEPKIDSLSDLIELKAADHIVMGHEVDSDELSDGEAAELIFELGDDPRRFGLPSPRDEEDD